MIMRSTPFRTAFFALLLTSATPSVLAAAPSAPLQLSQAELLKYWMPAEGTFRPPLAADSRKVKFAEKVTLEFTVDKRGRTRDISVIGAKPAGAYAGWATEVVKAMRYTPTEGNTARTPVRSEIDVNWTP
ncbi:hypothetical protein C1924_12190 [Stenotrophomonas sp. ESTM1D_MKCIP4_1]|nr:hypothetical protein C1924_12190 [Stenotrophomonas sp. ESTM1D_MKCIP4_1]